MLQDWLRRKEIDQFARSLAADLGRRFPPRSEERKDKGAHRQQQDILDQLCASAAHFRQHLRLGVYGKAKLGNTFRWQLRELGYSEAFVRDAMHKLMLRVAGKA
jgi:hypothetical protein